MHRFNVALPVKYLLHAPAEGGGTAVAARPRVSGSAAAEPAAANELVGARETAAAAMQHASECAAASAAATNAFERV